MEQTGLETCRISKLYKYRNRCFPEYVKLGSVERNALDFITGVISWHTFDKRDRRAVRAIHSLARKGFVEVSEETYQFRLASKFA